MKKQVLAFVVCLMVFVARTYAVVQVEISAENLYDASSQDIGLSALVLMVVDTGNDGLIALPAPGSSLAIGAGFGGGNDIIVGKSDPGTTTAINGQIDLIVNIPLGGGIAAGQKVGLVWIPTATITTTTFSGLTWGTLLGTGTLPSDGGVVAYDFADVNHSGTDSLASHTAVALPEPSSLTLVGLGLFGIVGVLRRRK